MADTPNPVLTPSPEIPPMVITKGRNPILSKALSDLPSSGLNDEEQVAAFKKLALKYDVDFARMSPEEQDTAARQLVIKPPQQVPLWLRAAHFGTDVGGMWSGAELGSEVGAGIGTIGGPLGITIGAGLGGVGGAALGGVGSYLAKRGEDRLAGIRHPNLPWAVHKKNMEHAAESNAIWEMGGRLLGWGGRTFARVPEIEQYLKTGKEQVGKLARAATPKVIKDILERESLRGIGAEIPETETPDLAEKLDESRSAYPKLAERSDEALDLERTKLLEAAEPDLGAGEGQKEAVQELAKEFNNLLARSDAGRSVLDTLHKFNSDLIPKGLVTLGQRTINFDEAVSIVKGIEVLRATGKFVGEEENKLASELQLKAANVVDTFLNEEDRIAMRGLWKRVAHNIRLIRPAIGKAINEATTLEKMGEHFFKDPEAGLMLARAATDAEKPLLRTLFGARMYQLAGEVEATGVPRFNGVIAFLRRNQAIARELGINVEQFLTIENRLQWLNHEIIRSPELFNELWEGTTEAITEKGKPIDILKIGEEHFEKQLKTLGWTGRWLLRRTAFHLLATSAAALKRTYWSLLPEAIIIGMEAVRMQALKEPNLGPLLIKLLLPAEEFGAPISQLGKDLAEKGLWRSRIPVGGLRRLGYFMQKLASGFGTFVTQEFFLNKTPEEEREESQPHMPQGVPNASNP